MNPESNDEKRNTRLASIADCPSVAVGIAAGAGLIGAWLTPRGLVTSPQALTWMAVALLIGVAGGLVTGSRWSMLVTPVAFVMVFELARLGVDGPSVDGIHLGSLYGIIAFVLGRVVHGVLVLAPMILGAVYGVWLAGRLAKDVSATMGTVGWIITGLMTLALVALAVFIARPATTHPIVGPDGKPLLGSIAELITVPIGGHEQAMMVRGRSIELTIADDGPGIPPGVLRRIFDPFYTTKQKRGGTGLGLSIAYGIIAEHAGRITVDSTVGEGTAFHITLPVLQEVTDHG